MLQEQLLLLNPAAFFYLFVAGFSFGITCRLFAVVPLSAKSGVLVALGLLIGT